MEARNFEEDLKRSDNPKLRENWRSIFKKRFGDNIEIIFKDDISIQKGLGTDVTIKDSRGRRYSIELKTRCFSCLGKDWIMEIISHIYDKEDKQTRKYLSKKEGWIYTTTAEYVFHATLNNSGEEIIECIFYSLMPFKSEKWKNQFDRFENLWLSTIYPNGNFQLTLNKLIPEKIIQSEAFEFCKIKDVN